MNNSSQEKIGGTESSQEVTTHADIYVRFGRTSVNTVAQITSFS